MPSLRGIVLLGGALVASAACSTSHPCGSAVSASPNCVPGSIHVDPRSTVTLTIDTTTYGTLAVGDGGSHQPCEVTWMAENFRNDGHLTPAGHSLFVRCAPNAVVSVDVGLYLGDETTLTTRTTSGGSVSASLFVALSPGKTCNDRELTALPVTVTVEESVGGPAAAPKVVTDDYRRVFRIDFDTTDVPHPAAFGPACSARVAMVAHVWLVQTAADFAFVNCPPAACD